MDISKLPQGIKLKILLQLSTDDLFSCSEVNKSWNKMSSCWEIWSHKSSLSKKMILFFKTFHKKKKDANLLEGLLNGESGEEEGT